MWSVEELSIQHQKQKVTVFNVKKHNAPTARTDGLGLLYMGYQSVFLGRRYRQYKGVSDGNNDDLDDEIDDDPPSPFQSPSGSTGEFLPPPCLHRSEEFMPWSPSLQNSQSGLRATSQGSGLPLGTGGLGPDGDGNLESLGRQLDMVPELQTILDTGGLKLVKPVSPPSSDHQVQTDLSVPMWVLKNIGEHTIFPQIEAPFKFQNELSEEVPQDSSVLAASQSRNLVQKPIDLNSCQQFSIVHYENLCNPKGKSVVMVQTQDENEQGEVRVFGVSENDRRAISGTAKNMVVATNDGTVKSSQDTTDVTADVIESSNDVTAVNGIGECDRIATDKVDACDRIAICDNQIILNNENKLQPLNSNDSSLDKSEMVTNEMVTNELQQTVNFINDQMVHQEFSSSGKLIPSASDQTIHQIGSESVQAVHTKIKPESSLNHSTSLPSKETVTSVSNKQKQKFQLPLNGSSLENGSSEKKVKQVYPVKAANKHGYTCQYEALVEGEGSSPVSSHSSTTSPDRNRELSPDLRDPYSPQGSTTASDISCSSSDTSPVKANYMIPSQSVGSDMVSLLSTPSEEQGTGVLNSPDELETSIWDCIQGNRSGNFAPEDFHPFTETDTSPSKTVSLVCDVQDISTTGDITAMAECPLGDKPAISYKAYMVDMNTNEVVLSKARIATYLPLLPQPPSKIQDDTYDEEDEEDVLAMLSGVISAIDGGTVSRSAKSSLTQLPAIPEIELDYFSESSGDDDTVHLKTQHRQQRINTQNSISEHVFNSEEQVINDSQNQGEMYIKVGCDAVASDLDLGYFPQGGAGSSHKGHDLENNYGGAGLSNGGINNLVEGQKGHIVGDLGNCNASSYTYGDKIRQRVKSFESQGHIENDVTDIENRKVLYSNQVSEFEKTGKTKQGDSNYDPRISVTERIKRFESQSSSDKSDSILNPSGDGISASDKNTQLQTKELEVNGLEPIVKSFQTENSIDTSHVYFHNDNTPQSNFNEPVPTYLNNYSSNNDINQMSIEKSQNQKPSHSSFENQMLYDNQTRQVVTDKHDTINCDIPQYENNAQICHLPIQKKHVNVSDTNSVENQQRSQGSQGQNIPENTTGNSQNQYQITSTVAFGNPVPESIALTLKSAQNDSTTSLQNYSDSVSTPIVASPTSVHNISTQTLESEASYESEANYESEAAYGLRGDGMDGGVNGELVPPKGGGIIRSISPRGISMAYNSDYVHSVGSTPDDSLADLSYDGSTEDSLGYDPNDCDSSLTIYMKKRRSKPVGITSPKILGAGGVKAKIPSHITFTKGSISRKPGICTKTSPVTSQPQGMGLNQLQTVITTRSKSPVAKSQQQHGLNQLSGSASPRSPRRPELSVSVLSPGGSTTDSDDGSPFRQQRRRTSGRTDSDTNSPGAYVLASYDDGSDWGDDSLLWNTDSVESLTSYTSDNNEVTMDCEVHANWMAELPPRLHDIPLTLLAIPGSHISLAIERDLRPDMDISKCNYEMADFLRKLPNLGIFNSFRTMIKKIWKAWMGKQMLSITQQLYAGVRYFDLRITKYRSALYGEHGLYSQQLPKYLKEIKLFLDTHLKEVCVLHFGALNQIDKKDKRRLVTMLFQVFGAKLAKCPQDIQEVTLNALWRRKKQVIVIFPHSDVSLLQNHIFAGLIWSDTSIETRQCDSHLVSDLVSFLDNTYYHDLCIAQGNRKCLHVTRAVLAPDMSLVFGDYEHSSMREMTLNDTHPAVEQWLCGKNNLNIVALDYVGRGSMVENVIYLNQSKFGAVETVV